MKAGLEAFTLLVEAIQALMRENQQTLWGSVVKQTIQRKHPSFSESHHGYSSFSKMLEEAEAAGILKLRKDQKSGSYVVTGFGPELTAGLWTFSLTDKRLEIE